MPLPYALPTLGTARLRQNPLPGVSRTPVLWMWSAPDGPLSTRDAGHVRDGHVPIAWLAAAHQPLQENQAGRVRFEGPGREPFPSNCLEWAQKQCELFPKWVAPGPVLFSEYQA